MNNNSSYILMLYPGKVAGALVYLFMFTSDLTLLLSQVIRYTLRAEDPEQDNNLYAILGFLYVNDSQ